MDASAPCWRDVAWQIETCFGYVFVSFSVFENLTMRVLQVDGCVRSRFRFTRFLGMQ